MSYKELLNLQEYYRGDIITISNNYNFGKATENKFCNFVLKSDESYAVSTCQ